MSQIRRVACKNKSVVLTIHDDIATFVDVPNAALIGVRTFPGDGWMFHGDV